MRLNLWHISGIEISSNKELVILYAGNKVDKEFMANLAFKDLYKEKHLGKIWLWKALKIPEIKDTSYSLLITELPRALRKTFNNEQYFYIPCWVGGEIDISQDFSMFLKNDSVKSDARRIRKNRFTYEVTNERTQFHKFYYDMYLPYITKVYSSRAFITPYNDMMKKCANCDLLIVKKENMPVGGILLVYLKNKARLWSIGIKDGNDSYLKDGVSGALDYFAILHLKEKGYKRIHFGESRPFLKDGVMQYKKKWGQEIVEMSNSGFLLRPLMFSEGLKSFLANNPFIYANKKRLSGAVFFNSEGNLSNDEAAELSKKYFYKGVSTMNIYRFMKNGDNVEEKNPVELNEKMKLCYVDSLY